ncbi:MAG: histidine kinase N-terminal 7TM domain-containing protein, partial [Opitutaceae bacterium]
MSFWQSNPLALPQLLAAISAGIASWFAWRRRKDTSSGIWVLGMLVAAMWWSVMGALGILAATLPAKMIFSQIGYIGIVLTPLFFWRYAYSYSFESNDPPLWLHRSLELVAGITLLLVFTNPRHGLVWSDLHLLHIDGYSYVIYERGFWYWINVAFGYGLMVSSTVMLIRHAWISTGTFRHQSQVMLLAAACPWLFSIADTLQIGPFFYVDSTPVGFVVTGILLGWNMLRRGLMDVEPVATRTLFERMTDPVFVVDKRDHLVLANPAALARFGLPLHHVGQP